MNCIRVNKGTNEKKKIDRDLLDLALRSDLMRVASVEFKRSKPDYRELREELREI